MKIRSKFAIFIMIYIFIWVAAMSTIFNSIAMRGYYILEEESFQADISRVEVAFTDLITRNTNILADWAEWDDTYLYIHSPNEAFINSNISASFMDYQKLDYVFIYNPEGQVLNGFQYIDGAIRERIPQEVIKKAYAFKNSTELMVHEGRPLVFTTREITSTDKTAPPKGLLCFAFYLEQEEVETIEDSLDIDIKLVSSSEKYGGESDHITIFDHGTYKTALFKYGYVNDPHGIALQLKHPLSVIALGKKTMQEVMKASLIAFVIISSILYFVVRVMILRIKKLSTDVDRIAHDDDLSLRLKVKSGDEISLLTKDINLMLDRIETMNNQLAKHASIDIMTGVYNRRVGFEILEKLIDAQQGLMNRLTICYIDINNLKVVNDTWGHSYGDELIKIVSQTIKDTISAKDVICRLGGDEFLVIFPDMDEAAARARLDAAEMKFADRAKQKSLPFPVSISKGFISYDGKADIHDFIESADRFMYADKKRKKGEKKNN